MHAAAVKDGQGAAAQGGQGYGARTQRRTTALAALAPSQNFEGSSGCEPTRTRWAAGATVAPPRSSEAEAAWPLAAGAAVADPLGGKGERHPSSTRAVPPVGSTLQAKALSQGLADDARETETASQGLANANAQGLPNDSREQKRLW